MYGSLVLVILVVKYILHCFVANSLLSKFTHFSGKIVLDQTLLFFVLIATNLVVGIILVVATNLMSATNLVVATNLMAAINLVLATDLQPWKKWQTVQMLIFRICRI